MNRDYHTLLTMAIDAALKAGKAIMEIYRSSDFGIEYKADDSPLTLADMAAQREIEKILFPAGIPILSEENEGIAFAERKNLAQMWIVDPLDGTKEFIMRSGEFTVNIALIENHRAVMGVIYLPAKEVLYYSLPEVGAYKFDFSQQDEPNDNNWIKAGIKLPCIEPSGQMVIVASRLHMNTETHDYIDLLMKEHPKATLLEAGSSLKFCALAEGKATVYPRFGPTMEWDTAAGQAILEASGGKVLCSDESPLRYNRENLLNPSFVAWGKG